MATASQMRTQSAGKETIQNFTFGQSVDYYVFASNSELSFYQFVSEISLHLNAIMSMMDDFSLEKDSLQARFKMAYAQMKGNYEDEEIAMNTVDRTNLIVMQNVTSNFDKSGIIRASRSEPTFFPLDPALLRCRAIGPKKSICLKQTALTPPDYFVLVYARKGTDLSEFLEKLRAFPLPLREMTSCLFEPEKTGKNKKSPKTGGQSVQVSPAGQLLRNVFYAADRAIARNATHRDTDHLGIVPEYFKSALRSLPNYCS